MEQQPDSITPVILDCVLMPQGEVICMGNAIGWFKDIKKYLTPKSEKDYKKLFVDAVHIIDNLLETTDLRHGDIQEHTKNVCKQADEFLTEHKCLRAHDLPF